jgi:hypothetical protein
VLQVWNLLSAPGVMEIEHQMENDVEAQEEMGDDEQQQRMLS